MNGLWSATAVQYPSAFSACKTLESANGALIAVGIPPPPWSLNLVPVIYEAQKSNLLVLPTSGVSLSDLVIGNYLMD